MDSSQQPKPRFFLTQSMIWVIGNILFVSATAYAGEHDVADVQILAKRPWMSEGFERNVDEAAVESQRSAVAGLQRLLKKYRGTGQEAAFLERLADVEQQAAAIEFRIAHGQSRKKKTDSVDLTAYQHLMLESISALHELIEKFPHSTDLARAHGMLARAYDETGSKSAAEREYKILVESFPESEQASAAYMALAEMASDANDQPRALHYLSQVEKRPEDPRFPFALYKMAWAYYNLKTVDKALQYLEKTSEYYDQKGKKAQTEVVDQAFRENALLDVPLFYIEGREQKNPQLTTEGAIRYFESYDRGSGSAVVGRMIARYAKLLRSHGLADDLMAFKSDLIHSHRDPQAVFDVIVVAYEDQLNHRRLAQLVSTSREMSDFLKQSGNRKDLSDRAQKILMDTASVIQALIVKNKDSEDVSQLNTTLAGIYGAFTQLVEENDPRVAKVHYNLAESLFETGHFQAATEHYRWVVTRGNLSEKERHDAIQKSIASRYEELRAKNLIPKDLKAQPMGPVVAGAPTAPTGLAPDAAEWIAWVDTQPTDSFYFESSRCLYAAGNVRMAVGRLRDFAKKNPLSQYAIPAASLVVDTYVAGADWAGVRSLVDEFSSVAAWKGTQFVAKLHALDSEVGYKQLETSYSSNQYAPALAQAEDFLVKHPDSKFSTDALALAGNSALALKDQKKALTYLSKLIAESPNSEAGVRSLLSRAKLRESSFDFEAAAHDYQAWIDLRTDLTNAQEGERAQLQSRTLLLSWASGNSVTLGKALADPRICSPGRNEALCDRYQALLELMGSDRGYGLTKRAFFEARKGAEENKSIWAALALEGAEHLVFRDRNIALLQVVSHWSELDPLMQAYLLPSISRSIPATFRMNRAGIQEVAPLVLNERYLTYRVETIREFESVAAKTSKLPWARIRAVALNEVAGAYLDFSRGMRAVAKKKGEADPDKQLLPFEEKGQQLRADAFHLAADAAIEEEDLQQIAGPFIQDNPSQAKALVRDRIRKPRNIDLLALDVFDPDHVWTDNNSCTDPQSCLKSRFTQAIRQKRWASVAVLMHEAREKKIMPETTLGLMRSVSFSSMGAQADGLQELSEVALKSDPRTRQKIQWILLAHYFWSNSRTKTGEVLKSLRASGAITSPEEDSVSLARAAEKWIGG